jgi:hypothetical protein
MSRECGNRLPQPTVQVSFLDRRAACEAKPQYCRKHNSRPDRAFSCELQLFETEKRGLQNSKPLSKTKITVLFGGSIVNPIGHQADKETIKLLCCNARLFK